MQQRPPVMQGDKNKELKKRRKEEKNLLLFLHALFTVTKKVDGFCTKPGKVKNRLFFLSGFEPELFKKTMSGSDQNTKIRSNSGYMFKLSH